MGNAFGLVVYLDHALALDFHITLRIAGPTPRTGFTLRQIKQEA
jgi:hypothetical protein